MDLPERLGAAFSVSLRVKGLLNAGLALELMKAIVAG
jgi:hypothetical protein